MRANDRPQQLPRTKLRCGQHSRASAPCAAATAGLKAFHDRSGNWLFARLYTIHSDARRCYWREINAARVLCTHQPSLRRLRSKHDRVQPRTHRHFEHPSGKRALTAAETSVPSFSNSGGNCSRFMAGFMAGFFCGACFVTGFFLTAALDLAPPLGLAP